MQTKVSYLVCFMNFFFDHISREKSLSYRDVLLLCPRNKSSTWNELLKKWSLIRYFEETPLPGPCAHLPAGGCPLRSRRCWPQTRVILAIRDARCLFFPISLSSVGILQLPKPDIWASSLTHPFFSPAPTPNPDEQGLCPLQDWCQNVRSSPSRNRQDVQTVRMSITWEMDQHNIVYL